MTDNLRPLTEQSAMGSIPMALTVIAAAFPRNERIDEAMHIIRAEWFASLPKAQKHQLFPIDVTPETR